MIKILIGLLVLSIMVFVHEAGHLIAAKLCGVVVNSFSIGWGPVLLRKKIKGTEYRLSLIPIGGYCGMKGEDAFRTAINEGYAVIPKEEGSLYQASPLKRIIIAFAGPFANYLSAILCFAIISAMGDSYYTTSNKIAPLHYYDKDTATSALEVDLRMGDKIIELNGKKIETFRDIMQEVVVLADSQVDMKIERDGKILSKKITPKLNKKTGAGMIGVYPYVPLRVDSIAPSSVSHNAGLRKGDVIKEIEGAKVYNTIDLQKQLEECKEQKKEEVLVKFERDGKLLTTVFHLNKKEGEIQNIGLSFEVIEITLEGTGFWASIGAGFAKTHEVIMLTFKSFAILFKGVEIKNAVSGPLRITHMIGDVAQEGFKVSGSDGWKAMLYFISIISISLFIMNLLPIPVLDGGLILLSLITAIARREIPPKIIYRVQFVGFIFIALLFVFALTNDILFFIG